MTIIVQDRMCLFGDVIDGEMRLNNAGEMMRRLWLDLPDRFYVHRDGCVLWLCPIMCTGLSSSTKPR